MTAASTISTSFEVSVARSGYAWWYLDALSDDGRYGITIIAFIGSVFSPYYAWARKRGNGLADPANHCAINVALYASSSAHAPRGWAMTERGLAAMQQTASSLSIGKSGMQWENGTLVVTIDERTAPWGRPLRGVLKLHPANILSKGYGLDAAGRHIWCPIAPCARVQVELEQPDLCWSGSGYLDTNRGERPLEQDFTHWNWSRTATSEKRTAVLYDATREDGTSLTMALDFDVTGQAEEFQAPPHVNLPMTGWRMGRATRSDKSAATQVEQELEDAPFYSRSVIRTHLRGQQARAVHESLSLERWKKPIVQYMLPFRMPRRA